MTNEQLYQKALRRLAVSEKDLLGRCRRQNLVDARCIVAAALISQPLTRQIDVARILGISQAAVCHLISRHQALMEVDSRYRMQYENIVS